MTQRISCPICQLDSFGLILPDAQPSAENSPVAGLVGFTCRSGHVFFLKSSGWSFALASLDDDLVRLRDSLGKIEAAQPVNIDEIIKQLKTAVQSAHNVRGWVLSETPDASWQNREELDIRLKEIQKREEAKAVEQPRTRLLTLATELERGGIVHRRAARVSQLNHLRDQAIKELRSQAKSESVPRTLPGPESGRWIEWACCLNEPEDSLLLGALRSEFPHLDDFVSNLEPGMWKGAGSPVSEMLPEPKSHADEARQERSRLEASEAHHTPVSLDSNSLKPKAASEGCDSPRTTLSPNEQCASVLAADKKASKFCIYRKSEEAVVVDPKTVDHEMLAHFGEQSDGMGYYFHWDEVIASRVAKGEEFDMIRAYFVKRLDQCARAATQKEKECLRNYQRLIEITDWLDRNFTLYATSGSTSTLSNTCIAPSRTLRHLAEILPIRTRQDPNRLS